MPSEIHFFQYGGYWVDYSLRKQRPKFIDLKNRVALLRRFLSEENRGSDPYGASNMAGRYDEEVFDQVMAVSNPTDIRGLFESYVDAIYQSYAGEPYPVAKRLVEKSVENTEFAPLLRRTFPDCKFLHIVRNPYASMVSIRRSRSKAGYPYMGNIALSLRNSFYNLIRNELALDDYFVVRYEDIVSAPIDSLATIEAFLEISPDPSVRTPTLLGKPWGGNSTSDVTFTGITNSRSKSWVNEISDFEIALTNQMLGPAVIERFSYDFLPPRHSVMRQRLEPHRSERPGVYLRNRLFQRLVKTI